MIITNKKIIAQYIRAARNHGITKTLKQRFSGGKPWDYDILEPGYNYRLDEIRSALGLSQIKRISKLNYQRKKAFDYYNSKLDNVEGIIVPQSYKNDNHVYHLYIIRIQKKYGLSRNKLFEKLQKNGIRTSVHYKPLHKFSLFIKKSVIIDSLQNSDELYDEILSLPLYPSITRKEQDLVLNRIMH